MTFIFNFIALFSNYIWFTFSRSSARTWSYSDRGEMNKIAVTLSKQWIHLRLSVFWPPTSTILTIQEKFNFYMLRVSLFIWCYEPTSHILFCFLSTKNQDVIQLINGLKQHLSKDVIFYLYKNFNKISKVLLENVLFVVKFYFVYAQRSSPCS